MEIRILHLLERTSTFDGAQAPRDCDSCDRRREVRNEQCWAAVDLNDMDDD